MMIPTVKTNVYDLLTDFLVEGPSLDEIIAFRLPEDLKQRALELLELNRENRLTAEDRTEMEDFARLDVLISILKSKARLKKASKR
jgi:hypothetical protein